jgi:3'-5' exoribonuclease
MTVPEQDGSRQRVAQLEAGEPVRGPFVVASLQLRPFRNREGQYLDLRLSDSTGEVVGRMWEGAEEAAACVTPGRVCLVEGRVEEYRGQLQVVVGTLRPCEEDEYEAADFVRCASRPVEEMVAELFERIEEVGDPHLRALLDSIFAEEEFLERFVRAPGASRLHHACRGGLLEHTLSVVRLALEAARSHPGLHRDLLLTGALLHDLGKVFELEGETHFTYSTAGRFCGHIVLNDRFVTRRLEAIPGFPEDMAYLLTHMLLSHHGALEWGAPVKPKTPEAWALHYADNLDAKVQIVEDIRAQHSEGEALWSDWQRFLEGEVYLGEMPAPAEELPETGNP